MDSISGDKIISEYLWLGPEEPVVDETSWSNKNIRPIPKDITLYFTNPLNHPKNDESPATPLELIEAVKDSRQIEPQHIEGAELSDFSHSEYMLFRARLNEVVTIKGTYKKVSERGQISIMGDEPVMVLQYKLAENSPNA